MGEVEKGFEGNIEVADISKPLPFEDLRATEIRNEGRGGRGGGGVGWWWAGGGGEPGLRGGEAGPDLLLVRPGDVGGFEDPGEEW